MWTPLLAIASLGVATQGARSRFEPVAPLPTLPPVMMDMLGNGVGLAQQTARAKNLQGRILWIDATANIDRYNSVEKIRALVARIKQAGFNTIVFDVKPISGQVIYPSRLAPKLLEWKGKQLPLDFDPVAPIVAEAKRAGLPIYASLNAFSEGHRLFKVGPGYERREQQTVLYEGRPVLRIRSETFAISSKASPDAVGVYLTGVAIPADPGGFALTVRKDHRIVDGFERSGAIAAPTVPLGGYALYGVGAAAEFLRARAIPGQRVTLDTEPVFVPMVERPEGQYPLMMNPNHPEVRRQSREIVRELMERYPFDGIIYDDRLRYAGLNADFSEITRGLFERRVGRKVTWPDDVFRFTLNPNLTQGIAPGPLYDQWMAFRAGVLTTFLREIRGVLREARPGAQLAAYAGSWFGEYPSIGSNYASATVEAGFWFLSPEYRKTGFARELDFFVTGCYYPTATIYEAMGRAAPIGATVEGAGMLSNRLAGSDTWTYAGIMLSDFKDDPEGLARALQAACGSTQGVMVFDLSHDIDASWSVFDRAFLQPRTAPHAVSGVLEDVRRRRAAQLAAGYRDPPIIITAGSAGVGQ